MRHRVKLNFRKPEGEISRRELLSLVLPSYEAVSFGKLRIDGLRCSGCWLCAAECPTAALTHSLDEIKDINQLAFQPELCDACGKCIKACPEQCLQLKNISELEKMDTPTTVLFEDGIARCRECGNIIGSKAMIERLRSKIPQSLSTRLELCPVCKMKA